MDEIQPTASEDRVAWPEPPLPGFVRDVVLVTIDTLRADAVGFSGNSAAETPHIDRLAADGWVFERAHAHAVMTLPSHASLLTGRLPYEHGVRDNAGFVLSPESLTAAEIFAEAGFRTGAFVAAFPLDARFGLNQGFDVYDDSYPEGTHRGVAVAERSGAEVTQAAIAWWQRHEGERRFLWVHLYEPHAPYEPPAPFSTRFVDRPYLGEVAAADEYVGWLRAAVAPPETGSDVLLVVTSDHGEGLGDHGEETHGLFAYEATLAVPLVLWAEELTGARIDAPVRLVDVLPTMLEAAGVRMKDDSEWSGLSGHSLWRDRDGTSGAAGGMSTTYFEALGPSLQRGWAPLRGVMTSAAADHEMAGAGRLLKYISLPLPELYDLDSDPRELQNLHATHPESVTRLVALLPVESEWPPPVGAVNEETRRALESLGYLTSSGGMELPRTWSAEDDPKNLVDLDRMIQTWSAAWQDGRLDEAEDLARRTIRRRPRMGLGYSNLAQVLLDQDRVQEALRLMIDAERDGLAPASLQRQLALTLAEVGRAQDAVRLMERHARSNDPDSLNVLGLVLAEGGESMRARDVLLRAIEVDERNPQARQNLALVALHEADWPLCEREARIALSFNPNLPLAWNYLGIALFNQGRRDEAIHAWQQSIASDPGDLDVLWNLASVAARTRAHGIARPALERFVLEASAPAVSDRYAADVAVARRLLRGL